LNIAEKIKSDEQFIGTCSNVFALKK